MIFGKADDAIERGASFANGDRIETPASWGELAEATWESIKLGGEVFSSQTALERAYDQRIDRIFEATGQRRQNPMRVYTRVHDAAGFDYARDVEEEDRFADWLRALDEQFPEKRDVIRAGVPIGDDARALARSAEAREQELWNRTPGWGKYLPYIGASLAAGATDPVNLATSVVGGGPAGVGVKALVWQGIKAGIANGAVEAGMQPFVQSWRAEAGLDYGFRPAASQVAAAVGFGFLADAGVRGLYRGARRAVGHEPVLDDAGAVTGWRSPLDGLEAAARARPEADPLRRAAEGDDAALADVARATGLADDPAVRGGLQALDVERAHPAPEGIAAAEHARAVADGTRVAAGESALAPGSALPSEVTVSDERLAEVLARDPLDLAGEIRARPELLQEGLPWSDGRLRQAAMLARLDEAAWSKVVAGEISPRVAAAVAEYVPDPARHLEVARQVAAQSPRTEADLRMALSDAAAAPRSPEAHTVMAGAEPPKDAAPGRLVDDPYGADGAAHLEELRARHASRRGTAARETGAAHADDPAAPSLRELEAAIAEAQGKVPAGVTIRSYADRGELPPRAADAALEAEARAGGTVEGLTDDAGNIWVAQAALDPRGVLNDEVVHALVRHGVLTEGELGILSDLAKKSALYDRAAYERVYADAPDRMRALAEEDAAHVYAAWKAGRSFGASANAILRRISDFLERVRNLLAGRGFKSAAGVLHGIDSGKIARRAGADQGGGARFSLRTSSAAQLRVDMLAAARNADAKAKAQAERVALLDEEVRVRNEGFVTGFRDARGQADPVKALAYLLEHHGEGHVPEGFPTGGVAGVAKALEGRWKSELEALLHEFRPKFLSGKTANMARLENVMAELSGRGTGDAAAKAFADAWRVLSDRVRQEANAAGADIPKLVDWWLPQVHDRAAMIEAGKDKWLAAIEPRLDVPRILRENRDKASVATVSAAEVDHRAKADAIKAERQQQRATVDAELEAKLKAQAEAAKAARQDLMDDLPEATKTLNEARRHEIDQARSLRDQQVAAAPPAERAVIKERFGRAKAEIDRAYDAEIAKAGREHARLVKAFDRKVKADKAALEKDLAKERLERMREIEETARDRLTVAAEERDAVIAHGDPMTVARLREILSRIYDKKISDGRGSVDPTAPFDGVTGQRKGQGSYIDHREESRFLHFKDDRAWLEYQAEFGGGSDPFRAMMQHLTSMAKEVAARQVLGSNPEREIARLAEYGVKAAAHARPLAKLVDEAAARVDVLGRALLADPEPLEAITRQMSDALRAIDKLRAQRRNPSAKMQSKLQALGDRLRELEAERLTLLQGAAAKVQGLDAAKLRVQLDAATENLLDLDTLDVMFPRRGEFTGTAYSGTGAEDYARSWVATIEHMWDAYTGRMSAPVNFKFARRMAALRNLGIIGRGGSMVISSMADFFAGHLARHFTGTPAARTFVDAMKQLRSSNAREMARHGFIAEEYLHMHNDGARQAAAVQGQMWSAYLADRTITWQGLGAITNVQRRSFSSGVMAHLADLTGKSWGELGKANRATRRLLERYGFNAADWDAIRLDGNGAARKADFLSPKAIEADRGRVLADRFLGMLLMESDFASPQSMLRARAALYGATRPGTKAGEFIRTTMQFKTFAVMWYMLHVERALREGVSHGKLYGAAYVGAVASVMMLGGALVIQLKNMRSGKDPEPMDGQQFWMRAMIQGGGLGLIGDLFASETNRFGGGALSTFAGPVFGIIDEAAKPLADAYRRGSWDKVPANAAKTAASYMPGSSLWYFSLGYQRIVADQLQRALDPDAHKAFRRRVQMQERDYGAGFWWAPGDATPARRPQMGR